MPTTPAELRDKARHARRLARAIADREAGERLERYAAELEAEAGALEARSGQERGTDPT
jgi:hypothetical protein